MLGPFNTSHLVALITTLESHLGNCFNNSDGCNFSNPGCVILAFDIQISRVSMDEQRPVTAMVIRQITQVIATARRTSYSLTFIITGMNIKSRIVNG